MALVQAQEQPDEAGTTRATRPSSFPARLWAARRRILALLLAVAISVTIVAFREQVARLGAFGYPGLFLVNVFTSATVFLPMPGLALAFAAGASLNPWLVGLAVGSGAAVGELTGYLAGYSGQGLLENNPTGQRIQRWMRRYGVGVLFVMAVIPNPFFDAAGMVAGILRVPVHHFLAACWSGNVIKATTIALVGAETIARLSPLLERWLMR
ncbi:MAG: VTT domain-containing protein [Anaerolineae bacterium]|nr:VTT domain-containing protein [Anaerolineae bacterium]